MNLAKKLLTLVALTMMHLVLHATDHVQTSWCSTLFKGFKLREKGWEWPRALQANQLKLAHQHLLAAILSALKAGRVLAVLKGAHYYVSRYATTCSKRDVCHIHTIFGGSQIQ